MTAGRLLAGVGVPILIAGCFWALIATSGAHGLAIYVALAAFVIVLGLWSAFRELATHATASRLIGAGLPDDVIALAERQLAWRWRERGRAPFRIYLGWGFVLRGDWAEAERALGSAPPGKASWDVLWASAMITLTLERGTGNAATLARRLHEQYIGAAARAGGGPAVKLLSDDADAKIRVAEGDLAGARPLLEKLCNDIRLGPGTRALAHLWAARAALGSGERPAGEAHLAKAEALAPKTFIPRVAAELRAGAASA
jgi:hypothetical protein